MNHETLCALIALLILGLVKGDGNCGQLLTCGTGSCYNPARQGCCDGSPYFLYQSNPDDDNRSTYQYCCHKSDGSPYIAFSCFPPTIPIRIYKNDQSLVLVEYYSGVKTVDKATTEFSKDTNQVWLYTPESTQLRSQSRPDDCLDAYLSNGIYLVHTYPCDLNNNNQRWKINLSNGKIVHQVHKGPSGRQICLDVDTGRLQTWECNDAPWDTNQIWSVRGVAEQNVGYLSDFYNQHTTEMGIGKECLVMPGASEVRFMYLHPKNPFFGSGRFGEIWTYDPNSHLIRSTANNECLDAWEPFNGGRIHTWACDYQNVNQLWHYDYTSSHVRHLTHKNFCLDRALGVGAQTTPHLWECHPSSDPYANLQVFEMKNLQNP